MLLDSHIGERLELPVPSNCLPIALSRYRKTVPSATLSPNKIELQYFAIDKAGPCWEHILKTREVGLYVPGELRKPEVEPSVILDSKGIPS